MCVCVCVCHDGRVGTSGGSYLLIFGGGEPSAWSTQERGKVMFTWWEWGSRPSAHRCCFCPLGVPSHTGTGDAPHNAFPKTVKSGGCPTTTSDVGDVPQDRGGGPGSPSGTRRGCAACSGTSPLVSKWG